MTSLAIDLGAAATKAAYRAGGESRPLRFGAEPEFPTAVYVPTGGRLVVRDALSYLGSGRVVVAFKHRIGATDDVPPLERTVTVGADGDQVDLVDLVTAVLAHAASAAPGPVEQVVLTHPVAWGPPELRLMTVASGRAGLPGTPVYVTEPAAAAASMRSRGSLPDGTVAVFDLGASTLDIAVLGAAAADRGGKALAERGAATGGDDLDAALLDLVEDELSYTGPDEVAAFRRFRDTRPAQAALAARADKERLSTTDEVIFPAAVDGHRHVDVPIGHEVWERRIEPVLTSWLDVLDECLNSLPAGSRPALLLGTGGSVAMPEVREELAVSAARHGCDLVLAGEDGLGPGRHVAPGALAVAVARAERARREAEAARERAAKRRRESFGRELDRATAREHITDTAVAKVRSMLPAGEEVQAAISWRHATDVLTFARFADGKLGLLVLTEATMVWSCLAGVINGTLRRADVVRVVATPGNRSSVAYGHVKVVSRTGFAIRFWRLADDEVDRVRRWCGR